MTYLKDDSEPSLAFLREAADLCEVNKAWLMTGEGFPTEEHAGTSAASKTAIPTMIADPERGQIQLGFDPEGIRDPDGGVYSVETVATKIHRSVLEGMGLWQLTAGQRHVIPFWIAPLAEVRLRWQVTPWLGMLDEDFEWVPEAEEVIGLALEGLLNAFSVDGEQMFESESIGDFITGMVPTFMVLVEERDRQMRRRLEDLEAKEQEA